jgi:hypothetical protein
MKSAQCTFKDDPDANRYPYIVPPDLEDSIRVGSRVIVPTKRGEATVYVQRIEARRNPRATSTILRMAPTDGD